MTVIFQTIIEVYQKEEKTILFDNTFVLIIKTKRKKCKIKFANIISQSD